MSERKSVVIIGGGIAGLTAAHELLERGYDVAVYERADTIGGKAWGFSKVGTGRDGRKDYPAEHGFRFFLGWYHHMFDTLHRIPASRAGRVVLDNLVPIKLWHVDEHLYDMNHVQLPFLPPLAWIKAATICGPRRESEAEHTSWDSEVDAYSADLSVDQIRLIKSMPKVLSSTKSSQASTRSLMSVTSRSLAYPGVQILNAPTQEAWFDPWQCHLESLGGRFYTGATVKCIEMKEGRVERLHLETPKGTEFVAADYYICAVPAEAIGALCEEALLRAEPTLSGLDQLQTDWQVGLQLYLAERIDVEFGHFGFSRSPFALSGVQQSDFWPDFRPQDYGDGRVHSVLSVIIADWHSPGVLFGKPAKACTREEIIAEVVEQLRRFPPPGLREKFAAMEVVDWIIDPAVHLPGDDTSRNDTPLFMNTVGCYGHRPPAILRTPNLFLGGDWTRTATDITTMEGANESGRRAANGVLARSGSLAPKAAIFEEKHEVGAPGLQPMVHLDNILFERGLPHFIDLISNETRHRLVREADRFLQSDRSWEQLLEIGIDVFCDILDELQTQFPDLPLEPVMPRREAEVLRPSLGLHPPVTSSKEFIERVESWSGVRMRIVDVAPQAPPAHLDAYLDATNPIFEPLFYACQHKGKVHRLKFMLAINKWLKAPEPIFNHLVEVLQVCHTASLMIDDIMDRTDQRRGHATAHRTFGTSRTLGAAYTGVLQALLSVNAYAGAECLALAVEESARLHQGQSEELYFRDTATCPDEEQYLRVVENKTGGPFRLATRFLIALSPLDVAKSAESKLLELTRLVGIFFQIRDDHLDITSADYVAKKGVLASDFHEGKYSFPIVHCIQHRPQTKRSFDAIFSQHDISERDKQVLIQILYESGSVAYSLNSLRELAKSIRELTLYLGGIFESQTDAMERWMQDLIGEIPGWSGV